MPKRNKAKEIAATKVGFSARLREALKRKQMTINELAEKIDVAYEVVRRYANGEFAPRDQARVRVIAAALGVDPLWLVNGDAAGPSTTRVPLVGITNVEDKSAADVAAPDGFTGFAVRMDVVLGDGFELGDVVFVRPITGQLPPAGRRVLIEVIKAKKNGVRHLFRRAHYGSDLAVEYRAELAGNEKSLDAKDVKVLGVAEYLLTKLSK